MRTILAVRVVVIAIGALAARWLNNSTDREDEPDWWQAIK